MGLFERFGSGKAGNSTKEVKVVDEEGFADLEIPLTSATQVDDGGWVISARGLHNEDTIGFDVRLGGEWKVQDIDDGAFMVYWGAGAVIRSGAESDQFSGLLQDVYEVVGSSRKMPDLVEIMVASLATDPERIREEPLKMKMFIEPDGDDSEYAEFYLNVDLPGEIVQFREKDEEYRKNLVKAFCREA